MTIYHNDNPLTITIRYNKGRSPQGSPMLTSVDRDLIMQWLDTAVAQIKAALNPEQIILFGSWARGTASRRSDIDLLIIWETSAPPLDRIGIVLSR
jgi:uncharacterized protein